MEEAVYFNFDSLSLVKEAVYFFKLYNLIQFDELSIKYKMFNVG